MQYNPMDPDTWPDEQTDFSIKVLRGLGDGDLQPLADYLKAGHYIDPMVGIQIAHAIEKNSSSPFHLLAIGRKKGEQGWTEAIRKFDRVIEVGSYYERRRDELPRGSSDAILLEIEERFGVKKSQAKNYLQSYRKVCASE